MSEILVIGSMNMDMIVKTAKFPQKGETVKGLDFHMVPGGKGANQALAAAKLGGDVSLIGACGGDDFGKNIIASLAAGGVDTAKVLRTDTTTGIAAITVEGDGDNRIIIVEGANREVAPQLITKYEAEISQARVILLQLEIPLETILHIIEIASKYDTQLILDPAPAQQLPAEVYQHVDYILPNETELDILTGKDLTLDEKVTDLIKLGVENVIVTRGAAGVAFYSGGNVKYYKTAKVEVVDTTAAGDAFAGALAVGLVNNWPPDRVIKYAMAAATLSVTVLGAQTSLPDAEKVNDFMEGDGFWK